MIVIIEGLDGVGKTTICKEICKIKKYVYIKESFTDNIEEKKKRLIKMIERIIDDNIYIYDRASIIDDFIYDFLNDYESYYYSYRDIVNSILNHCKIIHLVLNEEERTKRFIRRGDKYINNEHIDIISSNYRQYYKNQNSIIYLFPLTNDLEKDINKIIKIIEQ